MIVTSPFPAFRPAAKLVAYCFRYSRISESCSKRMSPAMEVKDVFFVRGERDEEGFVSRANRFLRADRVFTAEPEGTGKALVALALVFCQRRAHRTSEDAHRAALLGTVEQLVRFSHHLMTLVPHVECFPTSFPATSINLTVG